MSMTTPNYQHLVGRAEQEEIKLLDGARGSLQGIYKRKLPYQMDYSVRTVEKLLIDEGNIHILDLRVSGVRGIDFEKWSLYADGYEILSGTRDFAHECFVKDAELFRKTCRKAVEESGLPSLTKREYLQIFGTRNMFDYFRKTSDISDMHILNVSPRKSFAEKRVVLDGACAWHSPVHAPLDSTTPPSNGRLLVVSSRTPRTNKDPLISSLLTIVLLCYKCSGGTFKCYLQVPGAYPPAFLSSERLSHHARAIPIY